MDEILHVTTQVKAIEQYFPMVPFINMLFKVILTWMKFFSVTILMKSIEGTFLWYGLFCCAKWF